MDAEVDPGQLEHPKKKAAFLQAYCDVGTVAGACRVSGVGRTSHYRWLEDDEVYAEAFEDAKEALVESLEAEAIRRARDGVDKGIYFEGGLVATEKQYSDTLLIFLLKANRPEKYKDRIAVSGNVVTQDANSLLDAAEAKVLQFLPGGAAATG